MFDKSNIFDLTLSVPTDSFSLFNTQNPGNTCNKDPLKSIAFFASDKTLFYYNQLLLSTHHILCYHRNSQQITSRKTIVDIPGKDKKSLKRSHRFFAIFFYEKENEHRILNNFNQISLYLFNVKIKLNSGIIGFLLLRITFYCDRCINTGEPAAVFVFPRQIKVVEFILPESNAAGSLFGWSLGRG